MKLALGHDTYEPLGVDDRQGLDDEPGLDPELKPVVTNRIKLDQGDVRGSNCRGWRHQSKGQSPDQNLQ